MIEIHAVPHRVGFDIFIKHRTKTFSPTEDGTTVGFVYIPIEQTVLVDSASGDAGGGESDGTIFLAVTSDDATVSHSAQIIGDDHRARLGAVEMSLDCLRRHLQGLAFDERVDFEKSK